MTKLLISIRDEQEALIASRFPIDIIDLKDPTRGALEAPDETTIQRILERLDGTFKSQLAQPSQQRQTGKAVKSLALGELRDDQPVFCRNLLSCFRYAKIGLAGMSEVVGWQTRWQTFADSLPPGVTPVGVVYVDGLTCAAPPFDAVLELVQKQTSAAILLDTFDKSSGSTLEILGADRLSTLLKTLHEVGVVSVIAGSVSTSQLPILVHCQPDFVGVRGAVCSDGRQQLEETRLQNFLAAWRQSQTT